MCNAGGRPYPSFRRSGIVAKPVNLGGQIGNAGALLLTARNSQTDRGYGEISSETACPGERLSRGPLSNFRLSGPRLQATNG